MKKAAVEADYPATYGYNLIGRADIRKALEHSMQCAVSALGVTAGEVLAEIYEVGQNALEDNVRLAALKFVHAQLADAETVAEIAAPVDGAKQGTIETTIVRIPDNGRGPKT